MAAPGREGPDRRDLILSAGGALLGAALPLSCGQTGRGSKAPSPPNVLLIVADDLGFEGLGCNGGRSHATPNLDRLAAQGIRFTRAYATPRCSPSRVQLLTGLYPFRTGWTLNIGARPREEQRLDPALPNLAHLLRGAGYATAVAGKWQLARFDDDPDHAAACGFERHCLWTWSYDDLEETEGEGEGEGNRRYWSPSVWRDGALDASVAREDVFGPDVYCGDLLDFLAENRERPFFAYYPATLPHYPAVPTPRNRAQDLRPQERWSGMVSYLDELVGRLVARLDELGLRERTLVLFTSDNGSPRQTRSLLDEGRGERWIEGGKGSLTEAGTRVPLIASWPGTAPAGTVADDLVDLSDLYPTLAELAGAEPPPGHRPDGVSFGPRLRGDGGPRREWVFCQLGDERFVRNEGWRLHEDGRLIDLRPDAYSPTQVDRDAESVLARETRASLQAVIRDLG